MTIGDFLYKMVENHPVWLGVMLFVPVACCAVFGVGAAEAQYEECCKCSEKEE